MGDFFVSFLPVIIEQPPHLSCDPLEALTGSSGAAGSLAPDPSSSFSSG